MTRADQASLLRLPAEMSHVHLFGGFYGSYRSLVSVSSLARCAFSGRTTTDPLGFSFSSSPSIPLILPLSLTHSRALGKSISHWVPVFSPKMQAQGCMTLMMPSQRSTFLNPWNHPWYSVISAWRRLPPSLVGTHARALVSWVYSLLNLFKNGVSQEAGKGILTPMAVPSNLCVNDLLVKAP